VIVRRPAAADLESDWTEADLREEWERLDLERDAWLVELDGRLAGYATFEDRGGGRLAADGNVHPGLRGRGIGSELLRVSEERARARADPVAKTRVALQNTTIETDACTAGLYEGRGYAPVRWFWKLVIELDDVSPPRVPAGIEIRPLRDLDEAPALRAALEEAFAEHWGWVGMIGVRPAWRRRGIAEALLRTAFAEFARRGERRVALGVDAESPTGATRLCERLGMRRFWEAVVYEKELRG
jgi:GNAT superfamily N-acetyltransferase